VSDGPDNVGAAGSEQNLSKTAPEEEGSSAGAIAGGSVGAVVVLAVVGAGLYCYKKKQVSMNKTLPDMGLGEHKVLATDVSQSKI
jgi:hypothetical protein